MKRYNINNAVAYRLILYDISLLADDSALQDIEKLNRKLAYTAPEQMPRLFWHGTWKQKSICEICQEFFPEDTRIQKIFAQAHEAELSISTKHT